MIRDRIQQCKHWALLSLLNFVLVSLLGVLLRYKIAFPLPRVNYKYLLNAHSHFAFAGWVSMAIFTGLIYIISEESGTISNRYRYQFNLAQIANFGMLLSFPFEGYATISIGFSCLSIFFSYWFAWQYRKDLAKSKLPLLVKYFARAGLFFFVLSSAGPYLLGYILSHRIHDNNLYQNAIYLFLHFQYNGWFSFGVLAIFFRFLYAKKIPFDEQKGMLFFRILFVACIPAYCLSLLWTGPPFWIFLLAALAGFAQLAGAGILIGLLFKVRKELMASLPGFAGICWQLSLLAFCIKILLQALSAIPAMGKFAFGIRPVIIGYLHLVMLGFISLFLVGYFISQKLFRQANRFSKTGLIIFILGILANEIFLFLQGIFVLAGNGWISAGNWLFAAALTLFAGLAIMFMHELRSRRSLRSCAL